MPDPVAQQIVEAIKTRLSAIATGSGYNTNAGISVSIGRTRLNGAELSSNPVLFVYDIDDEPIEGTEFTDTQLFINLSIVVDAFVKRASGTELHESIHALTADIKKAVLQVSDKKLGGLSFGLYYQGRTIEYPEDGGNIAAITMRFIVPYRENYGDPTT